MRNNATIHSRRNSSSKSRNSETLDGIRSRTSIAPDAPIVAGALLSQPISFFEYLNDARYRPLQELLFDENTAAGVMLQELRRAVSTFYFGVPGTKHGNPVSPGKLSKDNTRAKRLLQKYARDAYRGDPDRRGIAYWSRVAWLLWQSYELLIGLRHRAEKIKQLEITRIQKLQQERAKRAQYMRDYRQTHRPPRKTATSRESHR